MRTRKDRDRLQLRQFAAAEGWAPTSSSCARAGAAPAHRLQLLVLAHKVFGKFGADLTGRVFAVWGLAFKPNTDDKPEAMQQAGFRYLAVGRGNADGR